MNINNINMTHFRSLMNDVDTTIKKGGQVHKQVLKDMNEIANSPSNLKATTDVIAKLDNMVNRLDVNLDTRGSKIKKYKMNLLNNTINTFKSRTVLTVVGGHTSSPVTESKAKFNGQLSDLKNNKKHLTNQLKDKIERSDLHQTTKENALTKINNGDFSCVEKGYNTGFLKNNFPQRTERSETGRGYDDVRTFDHADLPIWDEICKSARSLIKTDKEISRIDADIRKLR